MADSLPNGTSDNNGHVDVVMQEDEAAPAVEPAVPSDPTDPNPPPQSVSTAASLPAAALSTTALDTAPTATTLAPTAVTATATPPVRPASLPPPPAARPDKPVAHGGPTRQYLNAHVTPHLLEGMKHLAVYEPEKPLLWLADFLRERSGEIEGV